MFAVIKTGGKQYKVAANDIIKVEKLEKSPGDRVEFTDVLVMGDKEAVKFGTPLVPNTRVCGTVLEQIRDDKIIVFKKNRRHNYRRKNGHRQYLTVIRITDILPEGAKPSPQKVEATAKKAESKVSETKSAAPASKKAAPTAASEKKAAPKKPVKAAASKAPKKKE